MLLIIKINTLLGGKDQDPELISSHRHTKTTTTHRTELSENSQKLAEQLFTARDTFLKSHCDGQEGQKGSRGRGPAAGVVTPSGRAITGVWGSSLKGEGLRPHTPPWGGETRISRASLWRATGLLETGSSFLKGECAISLTLRPSTEAAVWKAPGPYMNIY